MRLGKFLLTERLGRGGMAEVWKARIDGPAGYARKLVIKRILPERAADKRFIEMFAAEARVSALLNHSNVVHVYEFGAADGEYFLAMEYVHGQNLAAVLRTVRRTTMPPVGFGAYVARELCRALAYAHTLAGDDGAPLGIVHRDVSPSNVMLGFDGGVKLVDFGVAHLAATQDDGASPRGKLGYAAPEHLAGAALDGRADLFSTGVLLWEMLAGRRLFKGRGALDTAQRVLRHEIMPPSAYNPETPAELDRVCLRMLARDRAQRPATCGDAGDTLDEIVHALRWGAARLAAFMHQLFPDRADPSEPFPLADLHDDG
jgi:eukaryotic-like serine/threonine-protein kinase